MVMVKIRNGEGGYSFLFVKEMRNNILSSKETEQMLYEMSC